jgi:tRNA-2-methylthio-N6-dimethylallyladenosine synthase
MEAALTPHGGCAKVRDVHYAIWTIGCQMNKADSERVELALQQEGLSAAPEAEADVVVVNTCVVRGNAEDRSAGKLASLLGLKRRQPGLLLTVMGCLEPPERDQLREVYPHVDLFFTVHELGALTQAVRSRWTAPQPGAERPCLPARRSSVTAYVPIIYGCNNFCAYCIVPYRRGRERSRPVDEVLADVRRHVSQGAREVTLVGQNVDAYRGLSPGGETADLAALLSAVNGVDGLQRLRFLTSHPRDMTDRLISTMASLPRVCRAINLPVQAGDDGVLAAMGRGYTSDEYRALAARVRAAMPDVALTTDLIVGFPGETTEAFERSMALLRELRFDAVHVAAYSPRPGTRAAGLLDDVPAEEKRRRLQAVESLQAGLVGLINGQMVGSTVQILVEGRHKGKWRGRTRSDKIVFFADDSDWLGRLAQVVVTWAGPWSLQAEVTVEDSGE